MTDFKTTNPTGRGIALIFSNVGWGIAVVGLLLAIGGLVFGGGGDAPLTGRLAAAGVGVAVMLFGLFSVLMAAQTRAALDTADMTREMLALTRQQSRPARSAAPEVAPTVAAPRPETTAPPARPVETAATSDIVDDVPPMPAGLRLRAVPDTSPPKVDTPAVSKPKPKSKVRSEPSVGASPKAPAVKPHPIFSAKPPG
ncbi:hypothetical protein [Jannaschia marina]|uniref:hypothetical protein n=1 Tax=Jannaschia marina TaxID=2741674 RepID=UPI0015CCC83D|nr:hypothetical protein [Jannaschia marina]